VELPLRFALPGNECVSGPKKMEGKLIFVRLGAASTLGR
jgi:hypothetical protein